MIISFDIPNDKLQQISDALDYIGFEFDPNAGATEQAQRMAYFKAQTVRFWASFVRNSQLEVKAKQAEQEISVDFKDITS